MSLLNSREDENERQGARALDRYGPGGLSGRLNDQTYSLKSGLFKMPFSDEPMGTQFDNFKDGGQVRGAMQKMPMDGGPIDGPGTGKSDSIKTRLPVSGFVLPVEVVAAIGIDKLNAMIALFDQESRAENQEEGREEVPAKVSDGEFLVPPEVVQATGPEYWDSLIAKVTGQGAQPETGEHGEMMAAGGGLIDERNQAAEFWKTAPQNPVPIPGRANPANPADMMAARLKTSANAQAQQAPALRGQMMNQGALPPQSPIQVPVTPSIPTAPAYQTPDPHKNFLKNANNMMAGEGAIATGLAYDILNAPQNAGQVNGAIAGLKQRAGFDPNSTPYPSLKNIGHGNSKNVYDPMNNDPKYKLEHDKRRVPAGDFNSIDKQMGGNYGKGNIDLNNRNVYIHPDGKAISSLESFSINSDGKEILIPKITKEGRVLSDEEAIEHWRKTGENLGQFNSVEDANKYAIDLERRQEAYYYNGPGKDILNKQQLGNKTPKFSKGGEVKGYAEGGNVYDEEERKRLANAGKNFTQAISQPVDAAGRIAQGAGTALGNTADLYQRGGGMLGGLKNIAQGAANIGATGVKTIGAAGNTLLTGAPFPSANELARPTFGNQAPSLIQPAPPQGELPGVNRLPVVNQPVNTQQQPVAPSLRQPPVVNAAQPPQGAMPATIGKSANWDETGYRTDNAPQTLGWNESRWSNSGDPIKDAALNARQEALTGLRQQANVMNQNPTIAGALNPATTYIPQEMASDNRKIDTLNALERDKMAQPAAPTFAASDGQVYQTSGPGAQEFNKALPASRNKVDPRAAQALNVLENAQDEQQSILARNYLAQHFPDLFAKYVIGNR